jgi:hypothetical protein
MVNSTIWWVVFNDIALKGPLPRGGTIAITAANCITILGITRLLIRRRREIRAALPMLWAAGCALIMWFMIFSPIVWAHYIGYIAVFLPWLIWEGRQSWTRAFFAFQTIWLSWFPEFLPGRRWFGPAISHMFWAQVTLLGLALWRLHDGVVGSGAAGKAFHRDVAQGAKEDLILPERR